MKLKMRRKAVSILLTLSLLITMMVPLATPAFAGSTSNLVIGSSAQISALGAANLARIRITETDDTINTMMAGDKIIVTLPTELRWAAAGPYTANPVNFAAAITEVRANGNALELTLPAHTNAALKASFDLTMPVNVAVVGSGDIKVNISAPGSTVTEGDYVVGRFVSGGSTITAVNTVTRSEGTNRTLGGMRITETSAGSLQVNTLLNYTTINTIKLKLPTGMNWRAGTTISSMGGFAAGNATFNLDAADNRVAWIQVTAASAGNVPGVIDVVPTIDITSDAKAGDITIDVSGSNTGISSTTVILGKYADFGATVLEGTTNDIIAGRNDDVKIGEFYVKENSPGSLLTDRTVELTLPDKAEWVTVPSLEFMSGAAGLLLPGTIQASDRRKIRYPVAAAASGSATKIKFKDGTISTSVALSGDLKVTVGGTAGVNGEVVVAKVSAPVTMSCEATPDVKIGVQSQKAGDILIKEVVAEGIRNNQNLSIVAPSGVTFASKPDVTVVDGDIKLATEGVSLARTSDNDDTVIIRIQSQSSKPSTIKLSNIYLTADRTVPEGTLKLKAQGPALREYALGVPFSEDTAAEVVAAKTVTPAPQETAKTAMFYIGGTIYSVNGTMSVMDAAPYIKNDRTYVPVRYLAYAMGVAESDVNWDATTQTVTIKKGDKTVKMVLGSKDLDVNGQKTTMDVAPELTSDRTMLPARWVAEALGAKVGWNAATQTVLIQF